MGWRGDSTEASHPGSLGGTGEGAPAQQERIMVTSAFKIQRPLALLESPVGGGTAKGSRLVCVDVLWFLAQLFSRTLFS